MNNENGKENEFELIPEQAEIHGSEVRIVPFNDGQNQSSEDFQRNQKIKEAEEITNRLVSSLGKKQRGWEKLYLTLLEVKERKLFEPLGLSSFTAYVSYLSKCAGCQPSYIWRTWEAGRYYHDLTTSREGQKFREKMSASGKNIGDEVLSNVKKIAGKDTERALTILENFADGHITKKDIHQLCKISKKSAQSHECKSPCNQSGDAEKTAPAAQKEPSRPRVTASDILLAMSAGDPFGLYEAWKRKSGKSSFYLYKGHRSVYEVFAEFPVKVPGVSHSRRMDALVITNFDAGDFGCDQYEVTLRCIEIKVSEGDLKNDHKMGDYEPFANLCYLAVPDYMEDFAADYLLDGWGLLVYDSAKKVLRLQKEAARHDPELIFRTLHTLAVKKMKTRDFYEK